MHSLRSAVHHLPPLAGNRDALLFVVAAVDSAAGEGHFSGDIDGWFGISGQRETDSLDGQTENIRRHNTDCHGRNGYRSVPDNGNGRRNRVGRFFSSALSVRRR